MSENTGISWVDGTTLLSDLDFAYDIVLLHDSWEGMQTSLYVSFGEWGTEGGTCHRCVENKNHVDWQMEVIGKDSRKNWRIGGMWWDLLPAVGSTINNDGGGDREILIRLGKANSAFGRLGRIWASKNISVKVKVLLYEALILIMPCCNMAPNHGQWNRRQPRNWKQHAADGFARSCVSHGKTRWPMRKSEHWANKET